MIDLIKKKIVLDETTREQFEFANDLSFKARAISTMFLAFLLITIELSLRVSLPLIPLFALVVFDGLINQPYSFIRKRFSSLVSLLWVNTSIDILVIFLIMFYLGGITVPF